MADFHPEDAEKFLLRFCRSVPIWDGRRHLEYGYEIWIPKVVEEYFRETTRGASPEGPGSEPIWRAFYEAAWNLCRRGLLRPSQLSAHGRGTPIHTDCDGFSLTNSGRAWLARTEDQWFPIDADRYVTALAKASNRCGNAFTQRAHEAARCNESANYLACCAMSGAAAESVVLALAIAKTQDTDRVLKTYKAANGRSRVFNQLAGNLTQPFKDALTLGFDLLKYWRDAAAHGAAVEITEAEAYLAVFTLLRFANFAADNWTELTGRK